MLLVIAVSCNANGDDAPPSAAVPTTAPAPTRSPAPAGPCGGYSYRQADVYNVTGGCHTSGELATIARVHDAATYVLTDGRTVRLAGLVTQNTGSCGAREALRFARGLVSEGDSVNVVREPGAGTDAYGSLWAYLQFGSARSQDLGAQLAGSGYAEVYPGGNPTYAEWIARAVVSAKQGHLGQFGPPCGPPLAPPRLVPAPAEQRYRAPDREPDEQPAPKRRTGNSGHPCLPGERDGDGDGYCGEGR